MNSDSPFSPEPDRWQVFARAARISQDAVARREPSATQAPPTLLNRLLGNWGELWKLRRLMAWQRWSIRAAILALLAYGIVLVATGSLLLSPNKEASAPSPAVSAPALELPEFPNLETPPSR